MSKEKTEDIKTEIDAKTDQTESTHPPLTDEAKRIISEELNLEDKKLSDIPEVVSVKALPETTDNFSSSDEVDALGAVNPE
ncbi:MAG: hypothetical protein RCO49_06875 [Rickettsia endosymbiont of Argas persicus]